MAFTSAGAPVRIVPIGTATRRSGSEMATPILDWPRSSPSTRPGGTGTASGESGTRQQRFEADRDQPEGLLQPFGPRPPAHGQIWFPAGAAPDGLGRRIEQRGGGQSS